MVALQQDHRLMLGWHLYEDNAWQFVLLQLLGGADIAIVSRDSSVVVPTAARYLIRPFVYLVSLCVKHSSKTKVDKFLHQELEDLASIISGYGGVHLIVELDDFPAMEQTYGCHILYLESTNYNCL